MTAGPIPVVLDVDTGVDDACALLFAALDTGIDLRAVTCVSGNAPLADVVRNTLTVLQIAGRRAVPVGVGAHRPLLERPVDARHVHGADGMADLGLPAPDLAPDARIAVQVLRDVSEQCHAEGRPATLVPLAPMTNIALFARLYPAAFSRLGRIVFMGGGAEVSNATAAAEFNVFHDPEASSLVLDACAEHGVPVTMYGLDVFYEPRVTRAQISALRALSAPAPTLAADLLTYHADLFDQDGATIGDAGAVVSLLAPEHLRIERLPVRIELTGTWTRGRTIVDRRDWSGDMGHDPHGPAPSSIDVCLGIDGPAIAGRWLAAFSAQADRTTGRGPR